MNGPWKFYLNNKLNSGVFVGVLNTKYRDGCIAQSLTQRADNNFMSPSTWNGSYGWILGENSQICLSGNVTPTPNYGTLGKQGDAIELHVSTSTICTNCWEIKVSLLLRPSGLRLSMTMTMYTIPKWQCLIGLCHPGDCITLLS